MSKRKLDEGRRAAANRAGARAVGLWMALAVVICAGCGESSPNVVVKGKVVVEGGIPLDEGRLILLPQPESETRKTCGASIKPDGTFECYANQGGTGIPPGKYKVVVAFSSGKGSLNPYAKAFAKYTTVGETPLVLNVPPEGKTDVVFELKEPPAGAEAVEEPGAK